MADIVGKLWGLSQTYQHDGIEYGDCIRRFTYLLLPKMIEGKKAEVPPALM